MFSTVDGESKVGVLIVCGLIFCVGREELCSHQSKGTYDRVQSSVQGGSQQISRS
ncbi:hypothetical protein CsatB_022287 [Cannabis sativa]